jgi:hypothetical protein
MLLTDPEWLFDIDCAEDTSNGLLLAATDRIDGLCLHAVTVVFDRGHGYNTMLPCKLPTFHVQPDRLQQARA